MARKRRIKGKKGRRSIRPRPATSVAPAPASIPPAPSVEELAALAEAPAPAPSNPAPAHDPPAVASALAGAPASPASEPDPEVVSAAPEAPPPPGSAPPAELSSESVSQAPAPSHRVGESSSAQASQASEPPRPSDPVLAPEPDVLAIPQHEPTDDLTEAFFSKAPSLPVHPAEDWDDLHQSSRASMSSSSRRNMLVTLYMLGAFVVVIGSYVIYQRVIMPAPVALGPMSANPPPLPTIAPLPQDMPPPVDSIGPAPGARPLPPAAQAPAQVLPEPELAAGSELAAAADASSEKASEPEPTTESPAPSPTPALPPPAAAPKPAPHLPLAHEQDGYVDRLAVAKKLTRLGKHQQAIETYHDALSLRPGALFALRKIAYLHLNLGQNAQARHFADRVLQLDPSSSEAWIVLGAALAAGGDQPGALKAYRRCAELGTGSYVVECRRLAR